MNDKTLKIPAEEYKKIELLMRVKRNAGAKHNTAAGRVWRDVSASTDSDIADIFYRAYWEQKENDERAVSRVRKVINL